MARTVATLILVVGLGCTSVPNHLDQGGGADALPAHATDR